MRERDKDPRQESPKNYLLRRLSLAVGSLLLLTTPLTWVLVQDVGAVFWGKLISGVLCLALFGFLFTRRTQVDSSVHSGLWGMTPRFWLVLLAIVLINIGAWRRDLQWDFSRGQVHSLAPQSQRLVQSLEIPIRALAFLPQGDSRQTQAIQLLQRYAQQNPRFSFELIDPNLHPQLVERFELHPQGAPIIVIRCQHGDCLNTQNRHAAADIHERSLSRALLRLTQKSAGTVYFLEGHGEYAITPNPQEGDDNTYTLAAKALDAEGFAAKTLNLLSQPSDENGLLTIPQDAAMLVLAGPKADIVEAEARALDTFLRRGGRVLALVDPGTHPNLTSTLAAFKIDVDGGRVHDALSQTYGLGPYAPLVQTLKTHPITQNLAGVLLLQNVTAVLGKPGGYSQAKTVSLLQSSAQARIERHQDDKAAPSHMDAPFSIAQATTISLGEFDPEHHAHSPQAMNQGRLVVVGDSDFMTNRLAPQQHNADFFLNAVDWLAQRDEAMAIRPRLRPHTTLAVSSRVLSYVKILGLDLIPIAFLLLGAVVIFRRRYRG